MKISSRGRYALRLMIDIAQNSKGEWISLKEISKRQGISVKYLEQIVTYLTKSGLLLSSRGAQGGYMLSKSPDGYTVGQILRTIEGDLTPVACLDSKINQCERFANCPTVGFWEGLYTVIENYIDSVTLEALASQSEEKR